MKALRFQFSQHQDALAAAVLTWLWTAVSFPQAVFQPNSLLLASSRDSVKNIYTLAWQLAHGKGNCWEFSGMGWPFTEHVFYTDGHPLLAWILSPLVPGIIPAEWTAGVLHVAILLSFGFTAFILVKLLAAYNVRGNWIIVFCSLLPLCHPQALRWTGHYAMAYTCAIPLAWYLQVRWLENKRWKWVLLQSIHLLTLLLTHAYLGAISTAFAGLIAGFHVFAHWQSYVKNTHRLGQIAVATIGPLVAYVAMLKATDTHPFRTDQPFGFWDNISTWNAALLPSHGGLGALRRELGWGLNAWEGWGFWGAGSWLIILLLILRIITRFGNLGNFRSLLTRKHPTLVLVALASITLYAVGVGEPFLTGKNKWLEQWPLFMQFRAIGRFVWVAAWTIPVVAAYSCFQFASNHRSLSWLPWTFVLLFALDAFWMQEECNHEMEIQPNCFAAIDAETQSIVDIAKRTGAVAIHPVPWFQMGSECVGRAGTVQAHRKTLASSFHSGLPTTATHLTRTSIPESRLLAEWMSHPGLSRALRSEFLPDDEQKVILLYACDEPSTWLQDDWSLWRRAQPTDHPNVRMLELGKWLLKDAASEPWAMPLEGKFDIAFNGLDEQPIPFALEGSGAKKGVSNSYTHIASLHPDSTWQGKTIEASCWFWHGSAHAGRDDLQFEWVMEAQWKDGSAHWVQQIPVASSGDHTNGWTRASLRYSIEALPSALQCFAVGFGDRPDTLWADAFRAQFVPANELVHNSRHFSEGGQGVYP